jgi:hypothetical protein
MAAGWVNISADSPLACIHCASPVSGRRRREASGQLGDGEAQIEVAIESMFGYLRRDPRIGAA